jgi:hypothetical protein
VRDLQELTNNLDVWDRSAALSSGGNVSAIVFSEFGSLGAHGDHTAIISWVIIDVSFWLVFLIAMFLEVVIVLIIASDKDWFIAVLIALKGTLQDTSGKFACGER